MRKMILPLIAIAAIAAQAQKMDTGVKITDSRVHSLVTAPLSNQYMPPVIVLGGDDALRVNFDLMDYDAHYLRYSVQHCNADWQPSQLVESEYVDGFNYADITDYAQSNGTFANYYNYNFTIPNPDMRLKVSGNYVVRVYEQDDPDKVLLQTRFSVSENRVGVSAEATSRTDVDYNASHQQVAFTVTSKPGAISDPYNELTAVVSQNVRTDNEVTLTRPLMVSGNQVKFDHTPSLIFAAGNEYRRFETVNINTSNMGVDRIEFHEPYYHAVLRTDAERADAAYSYDQTQYGHFTVRCSGSERSNVEADYTVAHFSLYTGRELSGGTLHIDGAFAAGLPSAATQMRYNAATGCYEGSMLLKQGSYNYQYLWLPQGSATGVTAKVEGDKYQTINQYLVKVYQRPVGSRYDRLVGFGITYSGR